MTSKIPQISGLTLVISTVILFAVNAVVLYAAQMLFPQHIVLGTATLSYWWAICMSMGKLAILDAAVMPFVGVYEQYRGKIFSPQEWTALYFVVNTVVLWVISRYSEQFGLGVTSWVVIVALALVMDVFQGMAMMAYGKLMFDKK